MSHQVGEWWCLPDQYRFNFGASVASEATQQIFQGIPRLATICWVFACHMWWGVVSWSGQSEARRVYKAQTD